MAHVTCHDCGIRNGESGQGSPRRAVLGSYRFVGWGRVRLLCGECASVRMDRREVEPLNMDADVDGNELDACVSDHLPQAYRHLWPVWGAA